MTASAVASLCARQASAAASANLPPVGTHDASRVPDRIEIEGVTFTPEASGDDD